MGRAAQAFTKTPSQSSFSVSAQIVLSKSKSKDNKSKMNLSSALGFALLFAIILVILTPEAESKSIRPHRGALARRAMGMGGGRGIRAKVANRKSKKGGRGRKRSRKARRGKNGRRRGRQDEIPEADVVSDDGGSGDGGDVCEVLMFDRGDGTYSLKFVQNKCE